MSRARLRARDGAGGPADYPAEANLADELPVFATGAETPSESMIQPMGGLTERAPLLGDIAKRPSVVRREKRRKRKARWEKFSRRSLYYIPILDWLPQYSTGQLFGDLVAGVTIACIMTPIAISYASQLAHLQPVNGLFAAAIPSIIYAFLGTGRQVSVGPEATLSLLTGQLITSILARAQEYDEMTPEAIEELKTTISTLLTLLGGMLTFLFGLLRLGFMDAILSRALLRGFITAVGLVISIEQCIPALGLARLEDQYGVGSMSTVEKLIWLIDHLKDSHRLSAYISLVSIAFLLVAKYGKAKTAPCAGWVKLVPETFLLTIIATVLTWRYAWDRAGVEVLGAVKASNTHIRLPTTGVTTDLIHQTFGLAVTICVIGFVDSIVTAKDQAATGQYHVSPNRELVALGVANVANSLVAGSLPAFGSMARSRLNAMSGAKTQLASVFEGVTILLITFFALPLLYHLPKCVLASMILTIVFNLLLELPHDLSFFWRVRGITELLLMLLTFILSVFWDLQTGVLLSLVVSLVLTVKSAAQVRVRLLGRVPGAPDQWEPIDAEMDGEEEVPGVLVVRIRESLSFANASGLKERLRRLEMYGPVPHHPSTSRQRESASALVFHFGDVEAMDASSMQILLEIVQEYEGREVGCYFCHVKPSQKAMMDKAGIVQLVGQERFSPTVNAVLIGLQTDMLSHITIPGMDE